ncbi:hypothetical protein [Martelella endophytica]|uniref:Uncharacterized protein n=1 Tax=Martelella endophytica TaxID=1486262 RepID=A0A0D5LPZ7_MAREN|nr:hypothetical protein [Martelella endophytica]AJY45847.1 hypothetical protein TM49_09390 [Martelella endophytica]
MAKDETAIAVRDGIATLPEPLDLEPFLPDPMLSPRRRIKLSVPDVLGTITFAELVPPKTR